MERKRPRAFDTKVSPWSKPAGWIDGVDSIQGFENKVVPGTSHGSIHWDKKRDIRDMIEAL